MVKMKESKLGFPEKKPVKKKKPMVGEMMKGCCSKPMKKK